jgi:hypothetical protein
MFMVLHVSYAFNFHLQDEPYDDLIILDVIFCGRDGWVGCAV